MNERIEIIPSRLHNLTFHIKHILRHTPKKGVSMTVDHVRFSSEHKHEGICDCLSKISSLRPLITFASQSHFKSQNDNLL